MDIIKIGQFLAELRHEKGLTQDELGQKLGVTNKTVSKWENGNYMPSVDILQALSQLYGLTINEILSGHRLEEDDYREAAEAFLIVVAFVVSAVMDYDWNFLTVIAAIGFYGAKNNQMMTYVERKKL